LRSIWSANEGLLLGNDRLISDWEPRPGASLFETFQTMSQASVWISGVGDGCTFQLAWGYVLAGKHSNKRQP
jgi:hypothetical protein